MKKEIWLPLCALMLVIAVILAFVFIPYEGNAAAPVISVISVSEIDRDQKDEAHTDDMAEVEKEMRAIWVPYMTLSGVTKERIDSIVDNSVKFGYNAIIFHVRPFADALYDSEYFPSSHLFDGVQGGETEFDPLEYAVKAAHAKNIELHAWINPLRIQHQNGNLPAEISEDNPYNIFKSDISEENDSYVVDYMEGKFFNPGEVGAREYIIDGICEIVENYDVDGIHWDDYFYPADDEKFDDSKSYLDYLAEGGTLSLLEWRTENINILVRDTYKAVKGIDESVVFGIGPQGNVENCLNMGADVYEWCSKTGYIDYICPQIYWSFDHEVAPYDKICTRWRGIITEPSVKYYIGLALYKAGSDSDNGTWKGADDILAKEVRFARDEIISADGFMVYSYDYHFKDVSTAEAINLVDELAKQIE